MKQLLATTITALSLVQAVPAAIVLGYDAPKPYLLPGATQPGTQVMIPYYDDQGFRTKAFGSIPSQPPYNGISIVGPNNSASAVRPHNGTAHIGILGSGSIEIFSLQNLAFRAHSIDLAEYSTVFTEPKSVTFQGVLVGGGSVFTTFTTDGVIKGGFSTGDFETFHFPPEFTNLASLRSSASTYAFDNVTLSIIPEPAPLVLLGLPVLGWCCLRRRSGRTGEAV